MEQAREKSGPGLDVYWGMVRRRRWAIVAALVIGWAVVLAASWVIPPRYRSDTVILVEQQRVSQQYVTPNVTIDPQTRLQSMMEQIMSRTRLLSIMNKLNLYAGDRAHVDVDSLVERMRKDIEIDFVRNRSREELSAFKISYVAHSPLLAQQVTGELASLFIEENLKNRAQSSEDTTAFLTNQLDEARKNLDEQEQRLREFKGKYLGELPEQLQSNVQILNGLQARLQTSSDAMNRAEQQRIYLESLLSQYRGLRSQTASGESVVSLPALEQQLQKLQQQLAELSAKYTPNHPDVRRLKQEIAGTEELKRRVEADLKAQKSDKADTPRASSPSELQTMTPMMQIESQLKGIELEISNDRKEVRSVQGQIEQYQGRLNLTPVREQQLAGIIRDHQQSRQNYDELLKKKMGSELATNLEKRQQGEQFRVIDPPNLPQKPYFPDRSKMALIGIAVGLALAAGMVVILEFFDGRVYTDTQIKDIVTVPVMVSVPALWTAGEESTRRRTAYIQTVAMAVLLFVVSSVTVYTLLRG